MKRIKDHLSLFTPIYVIIMIGLGWLICSSTGDFFFITTYLLYIAIIMAGMGVIKYDRHHIPDMETDILRKEVYFWGAFLLCLLGVSVVSLFAHIIEPAYVLVLLLLFGVGCIDFRFKYKELKKRTILS
ncbi:hypothetical protein PT178_07490 [Erysipelothrix rhusiopathiae]|nr:hypothetical protein [Erysipelothrix rhusiopathiae]MDE8289287.1 hypothetical protein [Erysipelothrix rhusiopathiae]MDE8322129.1 hypothetical protein [Erysipelothrix rhusiopathiae]